MNELLLGADIRRTLATRCTVVARIPSIHAALALSCVACPFALHIHGFRLARHLWRVSSARDRRACSTRFLPFYNIRRRSIAALERLLP